MSNDDTFTSDTNYNADSNNTDSNSSATSATETEEEVEKTETTTTTVSEPLFQKGQKIQAQCEGWAKAYPGIIDVVNTRSDDTTSYGITFEDGEVRESVESTLVAPFGGWDNYSQSNSTSVEKENTFDPSRIQQEVQQEEEVQQEQEEEQEEEVVPIKTKKTKTIEESNEEINEAERQLEKDLAELASIMAEHTDDGTDTDIQNAEDKADHSTTFSGTMDGGDDSSEATFSSSEDDDDDFVF